MQEASLSSSPKRVIFTSDVVVGRVHSLPCKSEETNANGEEEGSAAGSPSSSSSSSSHRKDEKEQPETHSPTLLLPPGECDYIDEYSKGSARIGVVVKVAGEADSDEEDYYSSRGTSSDGSEEEDEEDTPRATTSYSVSGNHSIEENYAEVSWFGHTLSGTTLEHLDNITLVDRPIYFGEIVTSVKDPVGCTGVVTGARMTVDLLTLEDRVIRSIDTRRIRHVHSHRPGLWVLSTVGNPWLGRVEEIQEDIIIEFRDGSKCLVKHNKLHKVETYNDTYWTEGRNRSDFEGRDCRFYPGQRVKVKDRSVLETAKWLKGAASDHKRGVICRVEVSTLEMRWLMPIPTCSDTHVVDLPPPMDISPDSVVALNFDEFNNTDWCIGDWCLFSTEDDDLDDKSVDEEDEDEGEGEDAALKKNKKNKKNKKKNKLMVVLCSHTVCDVKWQNGQLSKNISGKELIALKHCDDSDFWPNDFVMMRREPSEANDQANDLPSRRSGVVQTVDHKARTAVVKWQIETDKTGEFILGNEETVSLYALDTHSDFGHYGIGSMVILLDVERARERLDQAPGPSDDSWEPSFTASIFGQIRALNEGKLHIVWADGSMSFEYPARVFCIDKDDLESMMSDYDSYSYSESYDGSSWETMPEVDEREYDNAHQAEVNETLHQVELQHNAMREEEALAKIHQYKDAKAIEERSADHRSGEGEDGTAAQEDLNDKENHDSYTAKGILGKFINILGTKILGTLHVTLPKSSQTTPGSPGLKHIISDSEVKGGIKRVISTDALDQLENPQFSRRSSEELIRSQDFESLLLYQTYKYPKFEVVENSVDDHYFKNRYVGSNSPTFVKAVMKQWSILKKGLPDGIWVKAYEDSIDLMRVIIVGSPGTPYHYGIFCFDIYIPATFPNVPPEVFYRSGGYRLNPNLYENGRICLSLLNTWSGKESEKWDPTCSSILQVLVSIQGLVLVPKPYFNEAGYEKQVGTVSGEKNAILYNESAHLLCLKLIINTLKLPPKSFEDLVLEHFLLFSPLIKKSMEDYSNDTPIGFGGGYSRASEHLGFRKDESFEGELQFDLTPSAGYKIMLAQIKPRILAALDKLEKSKSKLY